MSESARGPSAAPGAEASGLKRLASTPGRLTLLVVALSMAAVPLLFQLRVATYRSPHSPHHLRYKKRYLKGLATQARSPKRPNIVLILFDDLGFGDIGAYGSRSIKTPHLDAFAKEGVRLTNFYVPTSSCTPSRAAFLTGRYPFRTGLNHILFPSKHFIHKVRKARRRYTGLPPDELVIAEYLKAVGYATAIVGKWHLGSEPPSRPNDFGFELFYGVHCSNDMAPLPLYRNTTVAKPHPIDQSKLTGWYTDEALSFLSKHQKKPFFLYMPHTFPHIPLHPSKSHAGRSRGGRYGDVVEDLDRSVGRVLGALKRYGLEHNTLVVITSDNGPWHQGNPGAHRGRKREVFEGGVKVPFMARWTGVLPANKEIATPAISLDLLPTLLARAGIEGPRDRILDGVDIFKLLKGEKSPADRPRSFFYYWRKKVYAMRNGEFKLHKRHRITTFNPTYPIPWTVKKGPWLFHLALDPNESYDVLKKHPKVAQKLGGILGEWETRTSKNPRGWRSVKHK